MGKPSPVRVFLDSMNAGDVPAALAVLSEGVRVLEPAGLIYGGEYVGKDALLEMFRVVVENYSVEIASVDLVPAGDDVLAQVRATYTAIATGREMTTQFLELYTIVDGLIVEISVFPKDTRAMHDLTLAHPDD